MKTIITIEDGRVTVEVDDNQPVVVQTSPPEKLEQGPAPIKSVDQKKTEPALISPPSVPLEPLVADPICINCGDPMPGRIRSAKYCKKPECKKAQTKAGNDRYRAKKGGNVGVGRGRRKSENPGQFALPDKQTEPPLWQDAPPAKVEWRSKCHDAAVKVVGDSFGEGTNHWECMACAQSCDAYEYTPEFTDPWNCGACRMAGRLCRLHYNLEADGKVAPKVRLT